MVENEAHEYERWMQSQLKTETSEGRLEGEKGHQERSQRGFNDQPTLLLDASGSEEGIVLEIPSQIVRAKDEALCWEMFLPPRPCGALYTWGRGNDGQLGHNARLSSLKDICPVPCRVFALEQQVTCVSVGGGQQGCTAACASSGEVFTWGNNRGKRLGHGTEACERLPRRVMGSLGKEDVIQVACGFEHMLCLTKRGQVWSWGKDAAHLGRRVSSVSEPACIPCVVQGLSGHAVYIDAELNYSAAVLADGALFTWGANDFGKLGTGAKCTESAAPVRVHLNGEQCASVSLGSLYAGAVGRAGALWMWGYGGHGNLGLGSRDSFSTPQRVNNVNDCTWVYVACTRGQDGCKGGLCPTKGGQEGPHTCALTSKGDLYTFGTCHKGVLLNLGSKTGAFGEPWDELTPYKVGSRLRNGSKNIPLSPLSVWPPPYDRVGPFSHCASGHIHAAAVGIDGRAWSWGCGSNDGRAGVERFLNMAGEGKPPKVDAMKCYLMNPHQIGAARPLYWSTGKGLQGMRVLMLATGRNHMACIACDADSNCSVGSDASKDPKKSYGVHSV